MVVSQHLLRRTKCGLCPGEVFFLHLIEYANTRSRPELLSEWDGGRNLPLQPEQLSAGSAERVWWRCGKGHSWQASVTSRVSLGRGCPYCAGQRVKSGENDLASRYPEVAARWHPTRNGKLTPAQVMPHTHKRCWWLCEKGHEWQVSPTALIQGSGCPYCAGKQAIPGVTDLATTHAELSQQWHPERNGRLTPSQVGQGSTKKVWWLCERGHSYQAVVFSRVAGTGCPYCTGRKVWPGFNDLATHFPQLVPEWHPTLNQIKPHQITSGSHKQVWWQCREGHVWKAAVFARAKQNGTGCPVCAGTIRRKKPKNG